MKARTLTAVLVASLLLALAVISWRALQMQRHWESLLEQENSRHQPLQAELIRLQHSLAEAKQRQTEGPDPATKEARLGRRPKEPARRTAISLGALMAKRPELADLWIKSRKAGLNSKYGPLFRRLNLTPELAESLKNTMADQITRDQDIDDTARAEGLSRSDPAVSALLKRSEEQAQAEEKTLLGDAGYSALQGYNRSLTPRGMVSGLAAAVAANAPVTADQPDALTQVLANESPGYRAGGDADMSQVNWAAVDQAARKILSPEQFATWKSGNVRDPRGGWPRSMVQLQAAYNKARADENPK